MKTIVTHDGKFHADDVCAVAALSLLIDGPVEIIRTRDEEKINNGDFVVDVGGVFDADAQLFDHHQEDGAGVRENGIPYAAFGLVWKTYGEKLCGSATVAKKIDTDMVSPLDADDNGVEIFKSEIKGVRPYSLTNVINTFVSTWKETDRDNDIAFAELVKFVKALLAREIVRARAKEEAEEIVKKVYEETEDKRIIILDGMYPSLEILSKFPEPLYFIRPGSDGKWRVEAVKDDPKSFTARKDFPKEWAGKRDEEMAKISGVSDAVFCHRGLFLAVANSREGAIALAKLAVES